MLAGPLTTLLPNQLKNGTTTGTSMQNSDILLFCIYYSFLHEWLVVITIFTIVKIGKFGYFSYIIIIMAERHKQLKKII